MESIQKLTYDDFVLLNDHLSFHPGGLIATFNLLSHTPNINKEQTILDFGCGSGITLSFLKRLGFKNLIGYDKNPKAIEISKSKHSGIDFYNNLDEISEGASNIDLILLESVFSFNDNDDLETLIKSLHEIIKKTAINYIGIVDFFSFGEIPVELKQKMAQTFGVKKIRTLQEFQSIFKSITTNSKVLHLQEHTFHLNLEEKYKPLEQANKLMSNEIFTNSFESKANAETYFSQFIKDMLSTYKSFGEYFKYFECIISLQ